MPGTIGIISIIICGIVLSIAFDRIIQSPNDYKEKIVDELNKNGYTLVDIQIPEIFKTGPFPKFRVSFSPQTNIFGVSGERTRYRIVRYKNAIGITRQSWIRIEIMAFKIVRIKWIPEL